MNTGEQVAGFFGGERGVSNSGNKWEIVSEIEYAIQHLFGPQDSLLIDVSNGLRQS